ncbi:MAG: TIR domain-containing protein [Cyanobacteria bacterium P01_F01_bin.56]
MKKTILILAANPRDTDELRLGEEAREISEGLERSQQRDNFEIVTSPATRPADLQRALMKHQPVIVHFSGHGAGQDGLALEDDDGNLKLVSTEALSELFELFSSSVECVVLNACYADVQAEAICQHIDYVVGMTQAVVDGTAIKFATGFYDALGAGFPIEKAFKLGRNRVSLESLPGSDVPILRTRDMGTVAPLAPPAPKSNQTQAKSARVFISYKRDVSPDENVALELYRALKESHTVFIDQTMTVGTRWADHIKTEIQQSDALIVLLSERAVGSENGAGGIIVGP